MQAAGRLAWRSTEASNGGDETWTMAKPRRRLRDDEADEFGKVAGFRNADQLDRKFLQRSYEASLVPGLQDSAARVADMDRAGVSACVIFHGGLNGQSIPFSTTGLISWGHTRYNDLEPVGVRIYNRWLADFVAEAPERHIGIAHIPISDPEACVREVEWAAANGLKGVNLPARGDFPMLNDPLWEPLWRACEETGLSLNTHGGGGRALPVRGSRRPGHVHDGDRMAHPSRGLGDDPQRHLRPASRPQVGADRAVDGLVGAGDGRHGWALPRSQRRLAA